MTAPATNMPPPNVDPLLERLTESYAALVERTEDLVAATDRVPRELDDDSLSLATAFVAKQLKPHLREINGARTSEKEPFLSGGRTVDGFFSALAARMVNAITMVEASINGRLIVLAAEERARRGAEGAQAKPADLARTHGAHGGVATLTQRVGFEVVDKRTACANLWRLIDDEALAKAVRAYIRERGDGLRRQLADGPAVDAGIRFTLEEKALVR